MRQMSEEELYYYVLDMSTLLLDDERVQGVFHPANWPKDAPSTIAPVVEHIQNQDFEVVGIYFTKHRSYALFDDLRWSRDFNGDIPAWVQDGNYQPGVFQRYVTMSFDECMKTYCGLSDSSRTPRRPILDTMAKLNSQLGELGLHLGYNKCESSFRKADSLYRELLSQLFGADEAAVTDAIKKLRARRSATRV